MENDENKFRLTILNAFRMTWKIRARVQRMNRKHKKKM